VECCPTPLQRLCEVSGYWLELEHSAVHDPEHPKHSQWVKCLVSMQAMGELRNVQLPGLCADPCDMGPCIIMLKHEAMAADEWHNNVPQDLGIDLMQLCSLSIACVCPYHNPTATMGHSVHNIEISKPLTHTRYLPPGRYS
jgi:hypothetical protein